MKKLWPQQVGEEKQATEHKLCRDISRLCHDKASNKARNFFATNPDYVATQLEDKLCPDKVLVRTSNPLGYDIQTPRVLFITCMTHALAEQGRVLVMLFISVFEYAYFCFNSVF